MPKKKKTKNKVFHQDFTINESANAVNPVTREKKACSIEPSPVDDSWDNSDGDEIDIVEEINEDGSKNYVCKRRPGKNNKEVEQNSLDGTEYPEIVWYLISQYIKPEDVGRFARINRSTYSITKNESFWRRLYRLYCQDNRKLPVKLRLENSFTVYGLRQRVIRALHHTYEIFVKKFADQAAQSHKPHDLVKRCCTNVWYTKGLRYWSICFKFKQRSTQNFRTQLNFIEELGRIDANPDEDTQVLQVRCITCCDIPPLMGMVLSSVRVVLAQEFKHYRLQLGFNSGHHNVSRNILPECSVILDTVVSMVVMDWWHPKYPHFDNTAPVNTKDDESVPVLKRDFFSTNEN